MEPERNLLPFLGGLVCGAAAYFAADFIVTQVKTRRATDCFDPKEIDDQRGRPKPHEAAMVIRQNVATRELYIYTLTTPVAADANKTRQYANIAKTEQFHPSDYPVHDLKCVFCPGNEVQTPPSLFEIKSKEKPDQWILRVVPNKYPYVAPIGETTLGSYGDIHLQMEAQGHHFVVIESEKHCDSMPSTDKDYCYRIIHTFLLQGNEMARDERVRYVCFFKNHGPLSGGSLVHPHSQIIGLTVYPSDERCLLQNAVDYYTAYHDCLYCKMITADIDDKLRVLHISKNFIILCPFAGPNLHQIWILPKVHQSSFLDLSEEHARDLGNVLHMALYALGKVLSGCSWNLVIHNSPMKPPRSVNKELMEKSFHWFLEIDPKTYIAPPGGFAVGTGIKHLRGLPEDAAKTLREALEEKFGKQ